VGFAPTTGSGAGYWLGLWWLFPCVLLGVTTTNTVGIGRWALFFPFLTFVFPLGAEPLTPETLVKVGLISEAFGLSSSAVAFVQYGLVDRRLALSLVAGGVPFVVGGALLSFVIPEPVCHGLLGAALLAASVLLFRTDLGHGEGHGDDTVVTDGGRMDLPDDLRGFGPAGVETDTDGTVTRVDRDESNYTYTRGEYLRRFLNHSVERTF
jgi:hypothetical protein